VRAFNLTTGKSSFDAELMELIRSEYQNSKLTIVKKIED